MRCVVALLVGCLLILPASGQGQQQEPVRPEIRAQSMERRVFEWINIERAKVDLPALKWDERLADVARAHSRDMAERHYVSHLTPEGKTPTDRGSAVGYECRTLIGPYIYVGLGENIFQNNLYSRAILRGLHVVYEWNTEDEIVRTSVKGWMDSPGHRSNILKATFEKSGVGVAFSEDAKVLITQNFC